MTVLAVRSCGRHACWLEVGRTRAPIEFGPSATLRPRRSASQCGRVALTPGRRHATVRSDPHDRIRPRMVLTWIDYAVIAAYLLAITAFGSWFARFQKTTRRLLPDRPLGAVVGDLLHHRRDRDQHAQLHRRAGRRLRRQHDVPAAGVRLRDRPGAGQRAVPAGVLPRRAVHVVRAAAPALRPRSEERRRGDLRDHADVRRRHPAVRDRAGHLGRHAGAGDDHGDRARRRR